MLKLTFHVEKNVTPGRAITLFEALVCIAVSFYAFHHAASTRDLPSAPFIPLIVGVRMLFKNSNMTYHSLPVLLTGGLLTGAACFAALRPGVDFHTMSGICFLLLLLYLYLPRMLYNPQRY